VPSRGTAAFNAAVLGSVHGVNVAKRHVFEPSAFDPPDQDQYEYWAYTFDVDGREYDVRRYCDDADEATILSNVRNADSQALGDAQRIAGYLIEHEGVLRVYRYDTRTGVFGRLVASASDGALS
jgi:hypothetical protein